jgi:hypothetical protein
LNQNAFECEVGEAWRVHRKRAARLAFAHQPPNKKPGEIAGLFYIRKIGSA